MAESLNKDVEYSLTGQVILNHLDLWNPPSNMRQSEYIFVTNRYLLYI